MVQSVPGVGSVVLLKRRQLLDATGERAQLLDDLGPRAERRPLRLVGERHGHLGPDDPGERLDRVAFDRRQVIEAVHEHRRFAPPAGRGAERVDRSPRVQLGIEAPAPLELVREREIQRRDVVGVVGAAGVLGGPRGQRLGEPLGGDERALELGDQLPRGAREPACRCRLAEGPELEPADDAAQDVLALERRDPSPGVVGAPCHLRGEPGERHHRTEHRAIPGELPGVVLGVLGGRHDEHRPPPRSPGEGAEHLPGLRRVRGPEDEGQGH